MTQGPELTAQANGLFINSSLHLRQICRLGEDMPVPRSGEDKDDYCDYLHHCAGPFVDCGFQTTVQIAPSYSC